MKRSTHPRARGFTLIELLVVVGIILVLVSLLMAALGAARQKRLVVLAHRQVEDLAAALNQYYDQLNCYPPDTGDFGTGANKETVFDPQSLVKYLGTPLTDQLTKKAYGPFLDIPANQVKAGVYVDPWGQPYQLDAVHIVCTDTDKGNFQRVGEPYVPGTPEKELRDFKVWSAGPDKQNGQGSKANGARTGADADNITSWDN